uniref:Uncharacterized protein n=1 Tax=Oryza sativa subsp. japonica TaxID=39947 RepID=Q10JV4_ORYSJ|nr:hypothetical protein LOC_Os03g29284 [Oryza sativa Japonica Group]
MTSAMTSAPAAARERKLAGIELRKIRENFRELT